MSREQMIANLRRHLAEVREANAEPPRKSLDELAAADPDLHERVDQLRALLPRMRETEGEEAEA